MQHFFICVALTKQKGMFKAFHKEYKISTMFSIGAILSDVLGLLIS